MPSFRSNSLCNRFVYKTNTHGYPMGSTAPCDRFRGLSDWVREPNYPLESILTITVKL